MKRSRNSDSQNDTSCSSKVSQGTHFRQEGNALYQSSGQEGLAPILKISKMKNAIECYNKALRLSATLDERCSAMKNIAVVSSKLACYLVEQGKSQKDRCYYFNEAFLSFDAAYKCSSSKTAAWVDDLLSKFHQTVQDACDACDELSVKDRCNAVSQLSESIHNVSHLRAGLMVEIAQWRYHEGLDTWHKGDYKKCLNELAESYQPIEIAKKYGKNLENIDHDTALLENDVHLLRCMAESTQARKTADMLLDQQLHWEENINMDMIWKVVDLYREAVLLTREVDMEGEAIALSRLGNVLDSVVKMKGKAKECLRRSVQLAMSLHPKTFDSEEWYKDCHRILERYQAEVVQQESEKWQQERKPHLEDLKEELEELKKIRLKGDKALLTHIYENHPPKDPSHTLGEFPDKENTSDDVEYNSSMKNLLRKAVIHYHPDRATKHGTKWKVLCEEISKVLTNRYECYK